MAGFVVPYTAKRGPLRGIEYTSYRQYLNAREYLFATGERLSPAEAPTRARGMFGARVRERAIESSIRARETIGVDPETYQSNKDYFRARVAQQIVGEAYQRGEVLDLGETIDRLKRSNSPFEKLWRQAERQQFDTRNGRAFDRILAEAGMVGGLRGIPQFDTAVRSRYLAYIQWLMREEQLERLGEFGGGDFDGDVGGDLDDDIDAA